MEGRFDDGSCKEGKIFFDSEWLYSFKFDYKTCEVEFIDKERKSYFAVRQDCGYSKYQRVVNEVSVTYLGYFLASREERQVINFYYCQSNNHTALVKNPKFLDC